MSKTPYYTDMETEHLQAIQLPEGDHKVIIESYKISQDVTNPETKKVKKMTVLFFKGSKKGMVLNKTNGATLRRLFGSIYLEDYVGKEITIYTKEVNGPGGKKVLGIRIKENLKNIKI